MPGTVERRALTPTLKTFRDWLRGKEIVEAARYADDLASRTQPHPHVPGGPYHKLSKVYYYSRDARRLVEPSIEVFSQKLIQAGTNVSTKPKSIAPAKVYIPDDQ